MQQGPPDLEKSSSADPDRQDGALPLVSVIIPAYNGEELVGRAIETALAQTHPRVEVIVVDDGSTDGTAGVVSSLDDPRLRLVSGPNRGVASARNRGVALSAGDVVAFLDQDDYWFPHKLAAQLAVLEANPDIVAVGSLMHQVSPSDFVLGVFGDQVPPSGQGGIALGDMPFAMSSMIVWRATLVTVGPFDESLRASDDRDLVARLALVGRVITVNRILGGRMVHGRSGTTQHFLNQAQEMRFVKARLEARARGYDLSRQQFLASYRYTWRERWLDRAHHWYWRAAVSFAERRWGTAIGYGLLAVLGRPIRTPRRFLLRQLQRRLR